jgi:pentatricopeptide repeat protein
MHWTGFTETILLANGGELTGIRKARYIAERNFDECYREFRCRANRLLAVLFIRRISLWHTAMLILGALADDAYGQNVYGSCWLTIDQMYTYTSLLRSYVSKNQFLEALAYLEGMGYLVVRDAFGDGRIFASTTVGDLANVTFHFKSHKAFQKGRAFLSNRPEMVELRLRDSDVAQETQDSVN